MVEYSPYAYETHEDPYPIYAKLRAEAPVYRNDELDFWALALHEDVLAVLKDARTFSNREGVSIDRLASHGAEAVMSFLAMDPPKHTHMRALVSRGFTPRRAAALEPRIRELAERYLDQCEGRDEFDLIGDYAARLPMDVVSELLGVPEADRDDLRRDADLVLHREDGMTDVPPAGMEAASRLLGYFSELVKERERKPRDDLASALIQAEIDGDRLSGGDVVAFLFLMIIAGNETTTKLLGNAAYWLWRNPGERAKVLENPDLIPRWIEETLRYDNSTQTLARTLTRDVELRGEKLREGDRVLVLIGSANRDERVWDEPDRFDILRNTTPMLSFGHGTHFCLGAALARLEARIGLEEIQSRMPHFELDVSRLERIHSSNVRGFTSLPIRPRP